MRMPFAFTFAFALTACQGNGTLTVIDPNAPEGTSGLLTETGATATNVTVTTTGNGACGDVSEHDVTISGGVLTPDGDPADGAVVWLDDRAWNFTELGNSVADQDGRFTLRATGVTSVEDCWGMLDYVLVAEHASGYGEDGLNPQLRSAIDDGSLVVDLTEALMLE